MTAALAERRRGGADGNPGVTAVALAGFLHTHLPQVLALLRECE